MVAAAGVSGFRFVVLDSPVANAHAVQSYVFVTRGLLALLVVTMVWGTTFPAMKLLSAQLDALQIIWLLFAIALLVLGPLWAFNEQFMVREPGKIRPSGYKNLGELRRRLRPVMLRRDRKEVLTQLPERIDARYTVTLWPEQQALMEDHEQQAAAIAAMVAKIVAYERAAPTAAAVPTVAAQALTLPSPAEGRG